MNENLPPATLIRNLGPLDASRRQFARDAERGAQVRIATGAYIESAVLAQLSERHRYLARIRAVAETRRFVPVLSHWSAAAIHGLPLIGPYPAGVHVTIGKIPGGRSRNGVIKHALALGDDDVVERDGLLVTTIERTVVDMAISLPFRDAVVMADKALLEDRFGRVMPLTDKSTLLACWEARRPFRGFARARRVLEFAETRSESPLESVSRVNMYSIGCPRPELQVMQIDDDGDIGESDFAWPAFNAVAEADGEAKYLDAALRKGRTIEQVMIDEKYREDRIRGIPREFVRWRWAVGINPAALRQKLVRLGLPTGVGW